eukprot:scaffold7362_cov266-Pinguiococcus_pyrenoidosus.AAC.14
MTPAESIGVARSESAGALPEVLHAVDQLRMPSKSPDKALHAKSCHRNHLGAAKVDRYTLLICGACSTVSRLSGLRNLDWPIGILGKAFLVHLLVVGCAEAVCRPRFLGAIARSAAPMHQAFKQRPVQLPSDVEQNAVEDAGDDKSAQKRPNLIFEPAHALPVKHAGQTRCGSLPALAANLFEMFHEIPRRVNADALHPPGVAQQPFGRFPSGPLLHRGAEQNVRQQEQTTAVSALCFRGKIRRQ